MTQYIFLLGVKGKRLPPAFMVCLKLNKIQNSNPHSINKAPPKKTDECVLAVARHAHQVFFGGAFQTKCSKKSSSIGVRSKMDAKVLKFKSTLNTHISGVLEAF